MLHEKTVDFAFYYVVLLFRNEIEIRQMRNLNILDNDDFKFCCTVSLLSKLAAGKFFACKKLFVHALNE